MSQLGVDDGLTAGGINTITQCHDGYLWVGTPAGLNRFDGYRIKTYLNEPGNSKSLLNNFIIKVFGDSRGWIWVITRAGGLHLYNANEDNFLRIPTKKLQNGLFEDSNGDIWCEIGSNEYNIIQVNRNFNTVNSKGNTFDDFTVKTQEELYPNLPKGMEKNKMGFSKNNGLWLYNNDVLYNYQLNKNRQGAALRSKIKTKDLNNVSLGVNPNNDEILLCADSEILIFDGKAEKHVASIAVPKELITNKSLDFIDHKNRLWKLADDAFYRVSLDTKEWEKISLQSIGPRQELLTQTKSIFQDNLHNIWFGTRGYGLFKHSRTDEAFNYLGTDRIEPSIHKIEQLNDSSLLVSTSRDEYPLKILDYKNNSITDLLVYESSSKERENIIFVDFFKDAQERFWLPSKKHENGKYKVFVLNNKLELINEIESPRYKEKQTILNKVFETENGQIWGIGSLVLIDEIETYPHVYLSKWSEEDKQFYIESVFEDHPEDFLFNRCAVTLETADKSLWFGFESGGLLKYDRSTKTWKHVLKKNTSNDKNYFNILSSHNSIGQTDEFMLGTRSGIMLYDYKEDTYEIYNKDHGLKDNVINGILTDNHRNIWLSTNKGLLRYDIKTELITNFSAEDGLQSSEFNRAAYFKNEDGTLFFGGVGGLTWFNPADLEIPLDDSKISITGLKLNNKRADSLLFKGTTIELPYDFGLITFEFAKLNLNSKTKNQYVYKLEKDSNSEDWINIRDQSSITFTELSPASYTVYISGFNSAGKIHDHYTAITFSILEPWWCNDWLKLLGVLIIMAVVYYFYVVKSKSKKNLKNVKTSISRDLHDEIGSTLSSITLYGEVARKQVDSDPKNAKKLIHQMNAHASESIAAMNDIVWTLKDGNDTVKNLLNRIRYHFTELENTGNWHLSIHCKRKLQKLKIDILKLRNIYLILKEGVNNAIKYSNGNEIIVNMYFKNSTIIIDLEDNGDGFDIESLNLSDGNGLSNMKYRAEHMNGEINIHSAIGKGTKINIKVPTD